MSYSYRSTLVFRDHISILIVGCVTTGSRDSYHIPKCKNVFLWTEKHNNNYIITVHSESCQELKWIIDVVATMIFTHYTPRHPSLERQRRAVKMGVFIAVKITTIIIRSRHLVLRLLGTYWSARVLGKGTCCARGRRITPSAPYLRQVALLLDCFFF